MVYEEVKITKAVGSRILNDIRTDLGVLYKGHIITEEDVVMLQVMGIEKVMVAQIENGDMDMKTVQEIIANKVCGKDTSFVIGEDGLVKVIADIDGFFVSDENRIYKFNNINEDIVLNTIPLYSYVKAGDIIAKIEFGIPLYKSLEIEEIIFSLSGNIDLLFISQNKIKKAAVIYSRFYKDKAEKKYFSNTTSKLVNNLKNTNLDFTQEYYAEHNINSIADEIENALAAGNEIAFIISSLRTQGDGDVVPEALKSIVDEVLRAGTYNIGVSDFIIANKRNMRIINLPFNYKNINSEIINEMILKTILNDRISNADFDFRNDTFSTGEKLSDKEKKKLMSSHKKDNKKANVAVAILAAGLSMRTKYNKLLADINNEKLLVKTVKNAIRAAVGPVFVVTGHQSEAVETALNGLDINIINNFSYREGVKTSIKLAINHVPSFCDGVILLPGDMPNISPEHLVNMVKKLDRRKNKQIVVTSYKGVKLNPVLWNKELMEVAEIIPDNSHMRPTLISYEDFIDFVEAKDENEVLDVDYPADIEKARKGS